MCCILSIYAHAQFGSWSCMEKMWNLGISFLWNFAFGGKSLLFLEEMHNLNRYFGHFLTIFFWKFVKHWIFFQSWSWTVVTYVSGLCRCDRVMKLWQATWSKVVAELIINWSHLTPSTCKVVTLAGHHNGHYLFKIAMSLNQYPRWHPNLKQ